MGEEEYAQRNVSIVPADRKKPPALGKLIAEGSVKTETDFF